MSSISNTIWGIDGTFRRESNFLTKLVDFLPLLDTKEKSTLTAQGEFAHLIPGHQRAQEKVVLHISMTLRLVVLELILKTLELGFWQVCLMIQIYFLNLH